MVEANDSGIIHIMKRPKDFVAALRDLHSEVWSGVNPVVLLPQSRLLK